MFQTIYRMAYNSYTKPTIFMHFYNNCIFRHFLWQNYEKNTKNIQFEKSPLYNFQKSIKTPIKCVSLPLQIPKKLQFRNPRFFWFMKIVKGGIHTKNIGFLWFYTLKIYVPNLALHVLIKTKTPIFGGYHFMGILGHLARMVRGFFQAKNPQSINRVWNTRKIQFFTRLKCIKSHISLQNPHIIFIT